MIAAARSTAPEATGVLAGTVSISGSSGQTVLAGTVVILSGVDADGNAVRIEVTTGADGSYRLTGLAAGTYSLIVPAASNAAGIAGNLGGQGEAGEITDIPVSNGADGEGYDFAVPAESAPIRRPGRSRALSIGIAIAMADTIRGLIWGSRRCEWSSSGPTTRATGCARSYAPRRPARIVSTSCPRGSTPSGYRPRPTSVRTGSPSGRPAALGSVMASDRS